MRRRPLVFTAKAMATMRRMAREGHSPAEIAEAIGSTPSSVSYVGNRYGISFGENDGMLIRLGKGARLALTEEAARRNHSVPRLITVLLNVIARDDLFVAVLGRPRKRKPRSAPQPSAPAGACDGR